MKGSLTNKFGSGENADTCQREWMVLSRTSCNLTRMQMLVKENEWYFWEQAVGLTRMQKLVKENEGFFYLCLIHVFWHGHNLAYQHRYCFYNCCVVWCCLSKCCVESGAYVLPLWRVARHCYKSWGGGRCSQQARANTRASCLQWRHRTVVHFLIRA